MKKVSMNQSLKIPKSLIIIVTSLLFTGCSSKNYTIQISSLQESNDQLQSSLTALQEEYDVLKEENEDLQYKLSQVSKVQIDSFEEKDENIKDEEIEKVKTQQSVSLTNGTYTVGYNESIQPGTYDLKATSGYGLIKGDLSQGSFNMTIGVSDRYPDHLSYNGLELVDGDKFEITSGVTIKFTPN